MKKVAILLFVGLLLKADLLKGEEAIANSSAETSNQQSTQVQNNNNITVGGPIQNSPAVVSGSAVAYHSAARTMPTEVEEVFVGGGYGPRHERPISLTPLIGATGFTSRWGDHVGNHYSLGLIFEIPTSSNLSVELEGGYSKSNISYSYIRGISFQHDFSQWILGSNLKFYLTQGRFRPYVAPGLAMVHYANMSHGQTYPDSYNHTLGAGQLSTGADVELNDDIALGLRLSYLLPMINRPVTYGNGVYAAPYFEEASAMNNSFYKIMGAVKIAL